MVVNVSGNLFTSRFAGSLMLKHQNYAVTFYLARRLHQ